MCDSGRRPHLRSRTGRLLLLAALAVPAGCAGTTRIGSILDDPSEFDGREVRIEGEVTRTVGVPLVGGTYDVDDGTGTLTVVSDEGGVPREGAEVSVVGTFRALFTLGARSLSVLQERDREAR